MLYNRVRWFVLDPFVPLLQMWEDPYLRWNTTLEGVDKILVIDSEKIWMPEIALLNTLVEVPNYLSKHSNPTTKVVFF